VGHKWGHEEGVEYETRLPVATGPSSYVKEGESRSLICEAWVLGSAYVSN
jgi:hypothetical protein